MALQPAGEIQLQKDDMSLAGLDARRADEFVDVYGAWSNRPQNALPLAVPDRRRRPVLLWLLGEGYAGRVERAPHDGCERLHNIGGTRGQGGALAQEIVGAGGARV